MKEYMTILILCIIFSPILNLNTPLPIVLDWCYNHPLLVVFIIAELITDIYWFLINIIEKK